jgi:thiol-disulfide isomerase/thioredoxin
MSRNVVYVLLAAVLPMAVHSQTSLHVSLSRARLADTATFPAAAQLIFSSVDVAHVKMPTTWHNIEVAPLLGNPAFNRISLLRYRTGKDSVCYAIDSGATVEESSGLVFREYPGRKVATVEVPVKWHRPNSTDGWRLAYQIILDTQGVTARPAECREGAAVIAGRNIPIRLILTSVNTPVFSLTGGTACLADTVGSGCFAWNWTVSASGEVVPTGRIPLTTPTILGGTKLRAAALDPSGENLTFDPYNSDTAMATGFLSPDWKVTDMEGKSHSLASARGKTTFMLFWSTTCPHCEKIRPMLNGLIAENDSASFQVIAACLEADTAQIRGTLKSEPWDGIIVPYDSVLWRQFNHQMSTPAVCLTDRNGVIRFAGMGESMFEVAEKVTRSLLETR